MRAKAITLIAVAGAMVVSCPKIYAQHIVGNELGRGSQEPERFSVPGLTTSMAAAGEHAILHARHRQFAEGANPSVLIVENVPGARIASCGGARLAPLV